MPHLTTSLNGTTPRRLIGKWQTRGYGRRPREPRTGPEGMPHRAYLLTVQEAATLAHVAPLTMRLRCQRGALPSLLVSFKHGDGRQRHEGVRWIWLYDLHCYLANHPTKEAHDD